MNRQQRKAAGKGQSGQRIDISGIVVHFANGQYAQLNINKINIIHKDTGRPLFDEVLEPLPGKIPGAAFSATEVDDMLPKTPHQEFANEPDAYSYTVTFDTPEGKMEYTKNGNWSGVRKAKS